MEREDDRPLSDRYDAELAVVNALSALGYATEIVEVTLDLSVLDWLEGRRPLVVFNLVDAVNSDGRLAPIVPARLESLGVPCTGCSASSLFRTISKPAIKLLLLHAGLPTPEWSMTGAGIGVDSVIVKATWEHGSLGLDAASVVDAGSAAAAVAERAALNKTEHFAEAYVEGREFQVFMLQRGADVQTLPITELVWQEDGAPKIFGYADKWAPLGAAHSRQRATFGVERERPGLATLLGALARTVWSLFQFSGYARVDFRVDEHGMPWIIDVNPNPYLSLDAEDVASAARAGISYPELINTIIESALT